MINQPVPGTGASAQIIGLTQKLSWQTLPEVVQHAARRHFVDTCGVIIAGMSGEVAQAVSHSLSPHPQGLRTPGSSLLFARGSLALVCGAAAHGIELDDGHRGGSVHPGVAVVPALLAASAGVSGQKMLAAVVMSSACMAEWPLKAG